MTTYYKIYRQELPKKVGSDLYPVPVKRFLEPLEKILIENIKWNPYRAFDVCCTEKNKRYPRAITEQENSLTAAWSKRFDRRTKFVYMATPYSIQYNFAKKAFSEMKNGLVIAGLFSYSTSRPAKWTAQAFEAENCFTFDLGRVRIDHWEQSNFNHLLILFGVPSKHEKLLRALEKFRYDIENKISVSSMAEKLNVSSYRIMDFCNKNDLMTATGRRRIHDGRNKIFYNEYMEHVLPAMLNGVNCPIETFFG